MFYYMYQITNTVNQKIYVGVHKTKSFNDGYTGSGKIIRSAIDKYGISNFSKVILEFFGTAEAMYAKEAEVVDEEFLERVDVYNLRRGGHGGFDYINTHALNYGGIEGRKKGSSMSGLMHYRNNTGVFSRVSKNKSKITQKNVNTGLHNEEIRILGQIAAQSTSSKAKRIKTCIDNGHQKGAKNSQFGTMWITDGIKNAKIKKTEKLPLGWNFGRSPQFN